MQYDIVYQGQFKDYHTVEAETPEEAAGKVMRHGRLEFIGKNDTQWFYGDYKPFMQGNAPMATIAVTERKDGK
jgi:hypothetical protein